MSDFLHTLPDLPVRAVIPEIAAALARNCPVVLQAPPGSGKTSLVPPALMDAPWLDDRRIVLLEPRRLAARAAARHMARLLGEAVGERIGYHIRLERRVSAATRVEILTEGLLVQRLLHDPELADVGLVIFDEFHERALVADQALALALDVRRALRPDLRILVMSATLDAAAVAGWLAEPGAPADRQPRVVTATARVWPVETRLLARLSSSPVARQAADAVLRALADESGSILVFLPGEGEIRRTAEFLREARLPTGAEVQPLYAALTREAQERAVGPPPPGVRKIVLATSIAESSLTIEGIRVVIDGGWMRVPRFSPRNGMSRLETLRVSRDRADQRRGRAGRLGPGICYRLWDEAEDRALAPEALPEILDADLAPLVLQCADWGAAGREDLPWPTPPPEAAWRQAVALLTDLGALEAVGDTAAGKTDAPIRITPRGRRLAALPIHPRLADMILRGEAEGCAHQACLLAAAVSELGGESALRRETDARVVLDRIESSDPAAAGFADRVHTLARNWSRRYAGDVCRMDVGRLLAWAFPDRIARRRSPDGRYLLASGRGAVIDAADPLARYEWLVAAELTDDVADARIRLAAPYDRALLEADFADRIVSAPVVAWDRQAEAVTAVRRIRFGAIVLRDSGLAAPDADAVRQALFEGIRHTGLDRLPWTPAANELRARVACLRRARPEEGWPDFSDAALAETLADWLGPCADGLIRWSQVERLDLHAALAARLGALRRLLDTLVPTHFTVPSGSHIRIRYDLGETPVIAVRIQEVFGLTVTPRVAGGRVAVLMHLLSPSQRPVQITADLESFWNTGYTLVRKELRGRYPKHAWPENPREAVATRRRKAES
jgi:ATP-dependent helicase HrpB